MELRGKVLNVLPVQTGVSKAGKDWRKEDFILEVPGSPNNKQVCITLFGDKVGLVKKGETQRRPGLHIESPVGSSILGQRSGSRWWGGGYEGGIFLASKQDSLIPF